MTKAHEAQCVALTRDIRALLVERQVSPPMTRVVLINTLVAMIKHLGKKDTMEEAAEDLVSTLQRAISKSTKASGTDQAISPAMIALDTKTAIQG
jgi:hypothetical protein